jgi:hypothetical protein
MRFSVGTEPYDDERRKTAVRRIVVGSVSRQDSMKRDSQQYHLSVRFRQLEIRWTSTPGRVSGCHPEGR